MKGRVYMEHPVLGNIEICEEISGISSIDFVEKRETEIISSLVIQCREELEEYFNGDRNFFSIRLDIKGTDFQKKCWRILKETPYGEVISYSEQAEKLGNQKGARAVGGANGKNPIAIIVPCHRVVGKNGKLTGYAGGLWRKKYLLELERDNKKSLAK
jgi:methylated-DNA-[protein]-cysteine S-methyltransferase